ncbi:MAG TPA: potassium transporter Kef, partial [Polyangiaceae bacterium]|nr:potassium transporter Kef [Polyangiaceae bacterium]
LDKLGISLGADQRLASLGAGLVMAETTRHMIRWVAERHGAHGPLSDWLADMARGSALVPVAAVAALSASFPHEGMVLPFAARLGITFGVGIVLGLVATVLLGREFRQTESWGILIGTSLLGMGVAVRLGLSPLGTSFALGLTLSVVSKHQLDIRALVQPTEKPVMLPVLLIAGLYVDFALLRQFWPLVLAALCARLLAELVRGALINVLVPASRASGPLIGAGLVAIGPITMAAALALNMRMPSPITAAVLNLAVVGALFGELIGPVTLRRALERAGETQVQDDHPDSLHPLASNPPPPVTEHKA